MGLLGGTQGDLEGSVDIPLSSRAFELLRKTKVVSKGMSCTEILLKCEVYYSPAVLDMGRI